MAEEYFDLFDKHANPLGTKKLREEVHRDGDWHQSTHIWIYNSKAEILFQKRSKNKDFHAGLWDISCAGHVGSGEKVGESAIRELYEELGINAKITDLEFIEKISWSSSHPEINWQNNEHGYIFFMKYDKNINSLKLQKNEVEDVRFIPIEKLKKELKDPKKYKEYVPHGKYYFRIIDMIKKKLEE